MPAYDLIYDKAWFLGFQILKCIEVCDSAELFTYVCLYKNYTGTVSEDFSPVKVLWAPGSLCYRPF